MEVFWQGLALKVLRDEIRNGNLRRDLRLIRRLNEDPAVAGVFGADALV